MKHCSLDISLIIPAYNEEHYLPQLLDSVDIARSRYVNGPNAVEIIIGDNSSTDRTAAIAQERGCGVAHVEKRCIAAARNGGAAMAQGNILCFVDADSIIHPESFNAIKRAVDSGRYIAGGTGVRMERMSPGIFCAYCMLMPMVWVMRMDTGVVFCRREDFQTVGGYNEGRLFGEDVEFLLNMRRLGRARGQRLVRLTQAKAVTSTRKFDIHGDWHYVRMILSAPFLATVFRRRMNVLARKYWYDERREAPR